MPSRRLPNTTPAVIRTLKTARDEWKNTPGPADRAITAEQWAQLNDADANSLLSRLLKAVSNVDLAQAEQAPLTSSLAQAGAKLTMFVSHFHQVFDLGVARGKFQPGERSYYGRDISATTIPDLSSYDAVADAADKIVGGEAARQDAEGDGFVAMALPSAAEVAALRQPFEALRAQSEQALVHTDQQREAVQQIYQPAQVLAVDICDTVEFFYRKDLDDASRRTKCQRWGVVYVFDSAGTPTPTPPPAPAPASTPN